MTANFKVIGTLPFFLKGGGCFPFASLGDEDIPQRGLL